MNNYKNQFTILLSEVNIRESEMLTNLYIIFENMVREIVKEELDKWQNDFQFKINPIMKENLYKAIQKTLTA